MPAFKRLYGKILRYIEQERIELTPKAFRQTSLDKVRFQTGAFWLF
jgi:hypothetical protein